jgi:hypothetical protein
MVECQLHVWMFWKSCWVSTRVTGTIHAPASKAKRFCCLLSVCLLRSNLHSGKFTLLKSTQFWSLRNHHDNHNTELGASGHAYNPNNLGGWNQEKCSLKPAWGTTLKNPTSSTTKNLTDSISTNSWCGGVHLSPQLRRRAGSERLVPGQLGQKNLWDPISRENSWAWWHVLVSPEMAGSLK